jgi:hypothetical protein
MGISERWRKAIRLEEKLALKGVNEHGVLVKRGVCD